MVRILATLSVILINSTGWSLGGIIAQEMAVVGEELGVQINHVVMLDSFSPKDLPASVLVPKYAQDSRVLLAASLSTQALQLHQPRSFYGQVTLFRVQHFHGLWEGEDAEAWENKIDADPSYGSSKFLFSI